MRHVYSSIAPFMGTTRSFASVLASCIIAPSKDDTFDFVFVITLSNPHSKQPDHEIYYVRKPFPSVPFNCLARKSRRQDASIVVVLDRPSRLVDNPSINVLHDACHEFPRLVFVTTII